MSQSIIAPQPKSKQNFPSIETNCKEGETKMLTAVPAEGHLALRHFRIFLCAVSLSFQGCVSPLPCPRLRVGAFCFPSSACPLPESVRERLCGAFYCGQSFSLAVHFRALQAPLRRSGASLLFSWQSVDKKYPQRRLWALGSIIICRCSQRTAKRMIQQHTGDNIPRGVNRTVSDCLRYPLLSY